MATYARWTILQLKDELRKYNATLSGKKQELIKKLEFYKANSVQSQPAPEYHMVLPATTVFKDIHGGMQDSIPKLKRSRLEEYLLDFQKQYEDKYSQFYIQRYIRYVRTCTVNNATYFTANVWAEMRNGTAYKVDIKVNRDGVIEEAQCECGAGQGPTCHCKHVATLYYGLTQFSESGEIVTELTCTEQLQTFHHAKAFKGSPLKAKDLHTVRGKENPLSYDPRPAHLRNRPNQQNILRNMCINSGFKNMPVLQLFEPANCKAIAMDHDYLKLTPQQQFLENEMFKNMPVLQLFEPANCKAIAMDNDYLKLTPQQQFLENEMVTKISPEQISNLEVETRGQAKSKMWLKARLSHITASHFGEICKATVRKDMEALAKRLVKPQKRINAPSLKHGRKYESVAVEKYEKMYGITTQPCGLFVSQEYPMLAASPDGVVDKDTLLEVKCPYGSINKVINPENVSYLNLTTNNELELDRRHAYYYQIQGQLFCAERSQCDLVIYTIEDIKVMRIYKDAEFCQIMNGKLLEFYEGHYKNALLDRAMFRNYDHYNFH